MKKRIIAALALFLGVAAAASIRLSLTAQAQPEPTEASVIATGWREIGGQAYYFLKDGTCATGWQEIGGKRYYFRENGSRVSGWLNLEGQHYYLLEDGAAASGVLEVDGITFLFDETGAPASGWVMLEGKRYYGNTSCRPLTGWQEIGGIRYLFGEDGVQTTGWIEEKGFSYYFYEDGTPAQGRCTIGGKSRTFAFNGQEVALVNPWNFIDPDYTVELVEAENTHQVADYAKEDFDAMMAACRTAGMNPVVCSGYRTQEQQETLYENRIQRWVATGLGLEEATEKAGQSVAVPGTSEHQLGLALDIIDVNNWTLNESQAQMPTQKWLMEHSWEYGWILRYPDDCSEITGIIYEPWHYRYVGRTVAKDIHNSGLCLEEYLLSLTHSVG